MQEVNRNFLSGTLEIPVSIAALVNQNIVTKMTRVHKNYIPKISIYMKTRLFTKIFSIENLEPYGTLCRHLDVPGHIMFNRYNRSEMASFVNLCRGTCI